MNKEESKRLKAIKQGSVKDFEIVFRLYYKPLLDYASSILKDRDEAEEIIQELFFKFWKNKESLEITSSLKSYLYRSVYNNCLQLIKHEQVKLNYSNHIKHQVEYSEEPLEQVKGNELHTKIIETLEKLPDRCKEIFKLNRFEGMKYHEIAEKLAISIKTVEANMSKALKVFRKSLSEYA